MRVIEAVDSAHRTRTNRRTESAGIVHPGLAQCGACGAVLPDLPALYVHFGAWHKN